MTDHLVGRIVTVSAGRSTRLAHGRRTLMTAFLKDAIAGPVGIGELGIDGDEHVYEQHGGPEMALLVYPVEHGAFWRANDIAVSEGSIMGENLSVSGLVETDVYLGDVFRAGTALVQVSQPRSPCYKIAARYGRRDLPVLVQQTGFTGYLLRVLEAGVLQAGDEMRRVQRDPHQVTVAEAARVLNVDRDDLDGARRVLAVEALGAVTRRTLEARLTSDALHGLDEARLFGDGDE